MDPLGFALENFDAIGRWRTKSEAGTPIDASAALPGDPPFEGPEGLRALLLGRREQFVGTVIEKLLAYALGRGLDYYDFPTVRKIRRDSGVQGLSLVVHHHGHRQERAVSDEEIADGQPARHHERVASLKMAAIISVGRRGLHS